MSTLLTSSSYIKIEPNKISNLFIKNTKTSNFSKSSPIIFKVKTNLIHSVDVRPAYGILLDNDAKKSVASLQIKYSGSIEQVEKGKLQINWIAIEPSDILDKKLQHNQFTELYKKYQSNPKQYKEYSIIVPFSLQVLENNSQIKDNAPLQQQPLDLEQPQNPLFTQNQNQNPQKIGDQNNISPAKQQAAKVCQKPSAGIRISFISLAILLILTLILGIIVGLKIQQWRTSINYQQRNVEEKQEIKQQAAVNQQNLTEQSQANLNEYKENIVKEQQRNVSIQNEEESAIIEFQNYLQHIESDL